MYVITAIESIRGSVNGKIRVNEDIEFILPPEKIYELGMTTGKHLTETVIAECREYSDAFQAFHYACERLAARILFVFEMRQVLKRKKFSPAAIDSAISQLKGKKYLDDRVASEAYVRAVLSRKPSGLMALKQALFEKGVDRDIVDDVLEQTKAAVDFKELARRAARKKLKTLERFDSARQKQKLFQFLNARGFDFETIGGIVRELVPREDDF